MAKPREIVVMINGDAWTIELLSKETYEKVHGKSSLAMTSKTDRSIVFSLERFSQGVVTHELWHSFCSYLYLNSTTDLTTKDFEEITAEMLEDKLEPLYKMSNEVYSKLTKKEKA